VGVSVGVGVNVGVRVAVGVKVLVGVKVAVGVPVSADVGVLVGVVGVGASKRWGSLARLASVMGAIANQLPTSEIRISPAMSLLMSLLLTA